MLFPAVVALSSTLLLAARADDPTEASQASILGDAAECTTYTIPLVQNALSKFPPLTRGVPVTGIVSGDSTAQAKFASFSNKIPTNIPLKGSNGVFGNTTLSSYPLSDPDCWWSASNCVTPKVAGLNPDIASVPEPKTLGYGFDDGPYCGHNEFYNFLESQNQKATMFYIGINVMSYPLQAQRAVADGHEVCVHTWSHSPMTTLTNEQAFAELYYTIQAIKLVTGYTPTCWRPPTGDVDDRIRFISQSLGLQNIVWKHDTFDWANGETVDTVNGEVMMTPTLIQQNYDDFATMAKNGTFATEGAIILAHELQNFTMSMAVKNYPQLAASFDHIVPVAVALNKTNPYVETNYTFPTFSAYVGGSHSAGNSTSGTSNGTSSGSSTGGGNSTVSGAKGQSAGVALSERLSAMVALTGAAGALALLALL